MTLALQHQSNVPCRKEAVEKCGIGFGFRLFPGRAMSKSDFGGRLQRMVQRFFDSPPKNDDESQAPIWCLGRPYAASLVQSVRKDVHERNPQAGCHDETTQSLHDQDSYVAPDLTEPTSINGTYETPRKVSVDDDDQEGGWPRDFLDDFESRIWLTYRSNFPPIPKSIDPKASSAMSFSVRLRSQLIEGGGFTSDTGWGCMIRSGQSLLANTLMMLRLGRDWRRGTKELEERKLLSMFADDPNAPFSIHRFVQHGAEACGTHPGQWFGPSATAQCIRALSAEEPHIGLKVYLTEDGPDVYEDRVLQLAQESDGRFHPILILVGIRLGIDKITPIYREALKASLQQPQSIGIAGGRPSSAHHFVGVQGENFFYMDPHQTRIALPLRKNIEEYSDSEIDSCHTRRLRRINVDDMDPSMLIAFLIRDLEDWKLWRRSMGSIQSKVVVHISDREPLLPGETAERRNAVDEVEILDTEDEGECDGEMVAAA